MLFRGAAGTTDGQAATSRSTSSEGRLSRLPFHWLVFAAYPVLFLYRRNLGELTPEVMLVPSILTLAVAATGMLVLSRFVEARRAGIIVSGLVVLLFLFGPISNNLRGLVPETTLHLPIALSAGVLLVVAALRLGGRLGTATLLLNAVSLVLVALLLVPIARQVVSLVTGGREEPEMTLAFSPTGPGTSRDIWWMIFDRYGSDASIKALYGIEDNDLGPWLESKGFTVLKDARANYVSTSLSLASALHMTHLDELAEQMGPDETDYGPIYDMLADHPVGRFLASQGYRFTQVGSWYPPTRDSEIADVMLRPGGVAEDFGSLVWDATVFPAVGRLISPETASRAQLSARFQWEHLGRLCREVDRNFVFAHILLPHPPYEFHADGSLAPPGQQTSYDEQMRYTNDRIRDVVECLLDRTADQQPIIIIQADEGPYPPRYREAQLTFDWSAATPTELLAKFSILAAMYLPGLPESAAPSEDLSLVNTFRYLLDGYFGTDLPRLPDRSYTSPKLTPYDLLDVTERIPSVDASLLPVPGGRNAGGDEAAVEASFDP